MKFQPILATSPSFYRWKPLSIHHGAKKDRLRTFLLSQRRRSNMGRIVCYRQNGRCSKEKQNQYRIRHLDQIFQRISRSIQISKRPEGCSTQPQHPLHEEQFGRRSRRTIQNSSHQIQTQGRNGYHPEIQSISGRSHQRKNQPW